MNWKLPNQLTLARVVLAAGFFVLLGLYEQGTASGRWVLNAAFVVYIIAGITDVLDGYFARRMKATSAFGRITDTFVDKILVIGAFAMLTGSNYVLRADVAGQFELSLPGWVTGNMASAVQGWMVVAILSRELIVSAIRTYSESRGVKFSPTYAGKIKMFVQSLAICVMLYQISNVSQPAWAVCVKIAVVWVAVIVTVISGVTYLGKARGLFAADA